MLKICNCGIEFESKHPIKKYCGAKCQEKYSKEHIWEKIKSDYRWRCKSLYASAKYRSRQIKVPFNITKEYLIKTWEEQQGLCALSGRVFDLSRPSSSECVRANAPSLDRINSKKGYVKGNVRFVCYQVNTALNQYGEEALISLCKDIVSFNSRGVA